MSDENASENSEFDEELEQPLDESNDTGEADDPSSSATSGEVESETVGTPDETIAELPDDNVEAVVEDGVQDPSTVDIEPDATSSEYFEAAAEAKLGTEIPDVEFAADATSGEYFEAAAAARAASEALESSENSEVPDAQPVSDPTEAGSIPEVPSSEDFVAAAVPHATTETPVSNTTSEAPNMADNNQVTPAPAATQGSFEEWVINPDSNWPPPIFLKKNVTPRERFYLEYRWHSQWSFYDSKATQNKNTYYWYQRIVVIGSLLIPTLISLNSTIARFITQISGGSEGTETLVRIGVDSVTVFISLAVAGSAALESLYKYGENWSSYRAAAEELQAEKNFYDMSAGPYATDPNPFATFVARTEGIIANQNGKYFQAVQSQIQKQSEENEAIVDKYLSGDDDDGDGDIVPAQNYDIG